MGKSAEMIEMVKKPISGLDFNRRSTQINADGMVTVWAIEAKRFEEKKVYCIPNLMITHSLPWSHRVRDVSVKPELFSWDVEAWLQVRSRFYNKVCKKQVAIATYTFIRRGQPFLWFLPAFGKSVKDSYSYVRFTRLGKKDFWVGPDLPCVLVWG